ncbi:MAG: polyprenyl synthetase family protein [Anaerolineaceae bacterium]|nr:polyprenyl synthetase family protein [Anaerolineaceae bacterium]
MNKLSFLTPVQQGIQDVEKLMQAQADGYGPDLHAALDLLLSSGGKRIRPALTLLTGRMLGGDESRLITLASAIELLHTATLVHDDLIDGALLRRGIPTLNSQWSPGATVLTGDFIFARAAKMAAETNSVEVMKLFAQTLTIIVNGELNQLFAGRCHADRGEYFRRIYAKTASLFETSTRAAALISQALDDHLEGMGKFGFEIGMAFQIIDDILDFTGEQATIGKPVGSDLRQGLVTLPVIIYLEDHPEDKIARAMLEGHCDQNEAYIHLLVEAVQNSRAIEKAHQEACLHVREGIDHLFTFPQNQERDSLEELAEYIIQRQF